MRWLGHIPGPVMVTGFYGAWLLAFVLKDTRPDGHLVAGVLVWGSFGALAVYGYARRGLGWDIFAVTNFPFVLWGALHEFGVAVPKWMPFAAFPLVLGCAIAREHMGDQEDDEDGPGLRRA